MPRTPPSELLRIPIGLVFLHALIAEAFECAARRFVLLFHIGDEDAARVACAHMLFEQCDHARAVAVPAVFGGDAALYDESLVPLVDADAPDGGLPPHEDEQFCARVAQRLLHPQQMRRRIELFVVNFP